MWPLRDAQWAWHKGANPQSRAKLLGNTGLCPATLPDTWVAGRDRPPIHPPYCVLRPPHFQGFHTLGTFSRPNNQRITVELMLPLFRAEFLPKIPQKLDVVNVHLLKVSIHYVSSGTKPFSHVTDSCSHSLPVAALFPVVR